MSSKLNDRLRPLMDALRKLALEPNADTTCIGVAELQIWDSISKLGEAEKRLLLTQLYDEASREEAKAPSDSARIFWVGVSRYASDPKKPKI